MAEDGFDLQADAYGSQEARRPRGYPDGCLKGLIENVTSTRCSYVLDEEDKQRDRYWKKRYEDFRLGYGKRMDDCGPKEDSPKCLGHNKLRGLRYYGL